MTGTHPPWVYCPQSTDDDDLISTLQSKLARTDDIDPCYRYARIILLTFCWRWDRNHEGGNVGHWVHTIGETFACRYQCEVRHTTLGDFPAESPEFIMSQTLREAARDVGPNDLIIVYYVGHSVQHGDDVRDGNIFLKPSRAPMEDCWGPGGPMVSFAHVQMQPVLDNPKLRVLWLLECDHDGSEALADSHEIIAASEFGSAAPNPENIRHFTSHLISELMVAAVGELDLTAAQLYCLLANKAYTSDQNGNAVLPSFPVHTRHRNNTRSSIRLIPSSCRQNFPMDHIGPPRHQPAVVLLSARLSIRNAVDWSDYRHWLEEHGVEVMYAFGLLPAVILFKVTFEAWCSLRGAPGLEFFAIERHVGGLAPSPWNINRAGPAVGGSYDDRVLVPFRRSPSASGE